MNENVDNLHNKNEASLDASNGVSELDKLEDDFVKQLFKDFDSQYYDDLFVSLKNDLHEFLIKAKAII